MIKPTIPRQAKLVFKSEVNEIWQWEQEMFDGTTKTFDRIKRPNTVKIVPMLPNGKILLVQEEQPSLPTFIGLPGGRVDEGEDALTAAKRELLEETGYQALNYSLWLQFYPNTSLAWELFVFIAKGLRQTAHTNPDAGEKITPKEVSFEEFLSIPDNTDFFDFRGGGLFNEALIRAQYDQKKREELRKLLFD